MLDDEDIIGSCDEGEEEEAQEALALKLAAEKQANVPDKWKKFEADLKKIRERESERDELSKLRKTLEKSTDKNQKDSNDTGLSKKEQKQMRKAFKELDKLERDNFIADLQKRDQEKTD